MMFRTLKPLRMAAFATLTAAALVAAPAQAWEPNKTVEFIVPAGTGGGADQMARLIDGIVKKHNLMPSANLVVINKSGGAGAEGFLDVKGAKGDPHKIIITLSNLFTTPLATGVPVNWTELTPVSMMALDNFVLWVQAKNPANTAKDYIAAAKAANGKFKMGGTGSKQEDQIITVGLEKQTGAKFIYVPFKGGGTVATQLVGGHVDSSVNNPVEAVAQWRGGNLKPLCVFGDARLDYKEKVTDTMSWHDIPTCKEAGVDFDYQMLRGIFMAGGVTADQVKFYVDMLAKVRTTPEWKDFMAKGAFTQKTMSGKEYADWVQKAEDLHKQLMTDAGFIAKQ